MTQTFKSEFPEFDSRQKFVEILNQLLIEIDGLKVQVLTNKIRGEDADKILIDLNVNLVHTLNVIQIMRNEIKRRRNATDKT